MSTSTNRILLLGWDAADWKVINPLLERGEMPHLAKLIERGVMGNLATLRPALSPMLWTSIVTGKRADKHGILGFVEPHPEGKGMRPISSHCRTCKALWNILTDHDMPSAFVGWFASQPAEIINGTIVTNLFPHVQGTSFDEWPLPPGCISPESKRDLFKDLRVHPTEITPEQIVSIVPQAAKVDQKKDKRLLSIAKMLAELSTIHAAGTWLAEQTDWRILGVYFDSIDHFGHGFMQYRPPRMPHVSEEDVEIYGPVIDHCYRLHDLMLGRYMRLVGPDTTIVIVSDHGFHSDHLRPPGGTTIKGEGFVHQHRPYGIFVAAGPDIQADQRVYGASLLDICPTLLNLLGLPVARDMDGKCLTQIFTDRPTVGMIDSYEREGERPNTAPGDGEDPWAAQAAMAQLAALGYIEPPDEKQEENINRSRAQQCGNLAQVYMEKGDFTRAAELFNESAQFQEFPAFRLRQAACLLQDGKSDQARTVLTNLLADQPKSVYGRLLMAYLQFLEKDEDGACAILEGLQKEAPETPRILDHIGTLYSRRKKWDEAMVAFDAALEHDPENPHAHHGMGLCLLKKQQYEQSAEHLMRSVALLHQQPTAHYHLSVALAAAGQIDWAIQASRIAIEQRAGLHLAHLHLAKLYKIKGDHQRAQLHEELAGDFAAQRASNELLDLPEETG